MRGENFFINARLVIITLQVSGGREFDEILVADLVLREQHEMVIDILAAGGGFFLQARTGRDIHLATDDGFHAFGTRFLVEIHHAMHRAMIRDGERWELQLVRLLHELVQTARAIEQRILGVQVQMDKVGM